MFVRGGVLVDSTRMGTWTCFYQTVIIVETGHQFDQSLLCWKRESVHGTIDKKFCAENIVRPYVQSHWAECLVSRRCLWPLMS